MRRFFSRSWPPTSKQRLGALACALIVACGTAHAISMFNATLESIEGDGWLAKGVRFTTDWSLPLTGHVHIDQVRFFSPSLPSVRNLRAQCARLALFDTHIECADLRIRGEFGDWGRQRLQGTMSYQRHSGALEFTLNGFTLAGGTARLRGAWNSSGWRVHIELDDADAGTALVVLRSSAPELNTFTATGTLDLDVDVQGRDSDLVAVAWRMAARRLSTSNQAGTLASNALDFSITGTATRRSITGTTGVWEFAIQGSSTAGQFYAEPVFMDLAQHPLTMHATGVLDPHGVLTLNEVVYRQAHVLVASGRGSMAWGDSIRIERLQLSIERADLAGIYAIFAQPLLVGGALGRLDVLGRLAGEIDIRDGVPSRLALALQDITLIDTQQRFRIEQLTGELHWLASARDDITHMSSLTWQGGRVLGLQVGAATLRFITAERNFVLIGGAHIPLFDGALELSGLTVERAGQSDMTLEVDAALRPISVAKLCAAFGWPQFGGTLGGRLTDLRLRDGIMTLGTTLHAQVFDGQVSIENLRLEQPFGQWPRFSASIGIDRLDLEQVTTAFSFGMITGRLSGRIDDLRLFNWSPIAFDARLYTPKENAGRRRISQRAVTNIGRLGGSGSGITAALSSGFLRFFSEFNYERLGIGCRLQNDVCTMSGVEPAGSGYYLVKGRSVPRIDVIGNAHRVDWSRLVAQLKAATQAQGVAVN